MHGRIADTTDFLRTEPLRMQSTSLTNPSNLAVPSTQNTAPVHCFRCLYTYDLRRKAKRWQDGAVRFHTFNKRIMVYDISRNFIGDTHWRDGGVIEDGDELELDKGVLIQVGEKTESIDQDLSGILDRRGRNHTKSTDDHDGPSVVPSLPSPGFSGLLSSPPQLRPKSLNAILGTPSGPLGRAAQPLKSPYELRLQKEHETGMQRDAKRRRVECASKAGSTSTTTRDPTTTSNTSNAQEDAVSRMAKVANEGSSRAQGSNSNARTRRVQTGASTAASAVPQTSSGGITGETARNESTRSAPRPRPTNIPNPKVLEKASGSDMIHGVEPPKDIQESDAPPLRKLQIISRKPRKKLIYQDILPSIAPTNPRPHEAGKPNSGGTCTSSRKRRKIEDPQAEFHRAQRERIESRLGRQSRRENKGFHEEDVLLDSINISSDEETNPPPLPALHQDATSTENHRGIIPQTELSLPRGGGGRREGGSEVHQNTLLPQRGDKEAPHPHPHPAPPIATSKHPPRSISTSAHHDLAEMDQILLPIQPQPPNLQPPKPASPSHKPPHKPAAPSHIPPHKPAPAPPPPASPTKPSNLLPLPLPLPITITIPPPIPIPQPQPQLQPPHQHQHHQKPKKRSPMRKTVSEPLDRLSTRVGGAPCVAVSADQAPDPWSREAWDLFGCERPVREKGTREGEGEGEGEGKGVKI